MSRRELLGAIALAALVDCGRGSSRANSHSVSRPAGGTVESGEPIRLSSFADATGKSDAAPGLIAAVAAAVANPALAVPIKQVYVDKGVFKLASEADLSGHEVQLIGDGGTLVPARGTGGGSVISSSTGILELINLEVDGGSSQPKDATETTFIVRVGSRGAGMERVRIQGCKFRNCTAFDDRLGINGSKVTHVIYGSGIKRLELSGNLVNNCSGAAVFLSDVASFRSCDNTWSGSDWYTFNMARNVSGEIDGDIFNAYKQTGIYWGGAVNTVNDRGKKRNRNIVVRNCTFSGYFSYGAIIRFQSDDGIICESNNFLRCVVGSLAGPERGLSCIRVTVRNHLSPSDVPRNILIHGNRAPYGLETGSYRAFIYINNSWNVGRNPICNTEISSNICRSPGKTAFFSHGVLVFGGSGGFDDLRVFDNDCELYITTPKPIAGGFGVIGGGQTGLVKDIQFGGNTVRNLAPPLGPIQSCFQFGPFVEDLRSVRPNTAIGGFYGLQTVGEKGRRMENIQNQVFRGCTIKMHLN